jgi:hypothetical protein
MERSSCRAKLRGEDTWINISLGDPLASKSSMASSFGAREPEPEQKSWSLSKNPGA